MLPHLCLVLLASNMALSCEIPDTIEETWGYVDVRPSAHQFWWFMKTPCAGAVTRPIIIWLQGGPGGSGTGYGNFMEIGPLDNNLVLRNYTWLKEASLIFIDSPVGAGFSYVDEESALTTTVYEVADDLVTTLGEISGKLKAKFYNGTLPPIYIFTESYGGKVAPVFGEKIVEAQAKGFLADVTLGAVAIGDGAVSMLDSATTYPDFLFQTSQIDYSQYLILKDAADDMEVAYSRGDYNTSGNILGFMLGTIQNMTDDVFVYNVIYHHQPSPSLMQQSQRHRQMLEQLAHATANYHDLTLTEKRALWKTARKNFTPFKKLSIDYNGDNVKKLMNTKMREKFGIIPETVKWGGQAVVCHEYLSYEMIIDVIDSVDRCLAANARVVVYNGMLDLVINSAGQDKWIAKLEWSGLQDYYKSPRVPLYAPSQAKEKRTGAFYKAHNNFEYYWIMMSGHMVPIDAPEMSLEMVRRIIGGEMY